MTKIYISFLYLYKMPGNTGKKPQTNCVNTYYMSYLDYGTIFQNMKLKIVFINMFDCICSQMLYGLVAQNGIKVLLLYCLIQTIDIVSHYFSCNITSEQRQTLWRSLTFSCPKILPPSLNYSQMNTNQHVCLALILVYMVFVQHSQKM